MTKPEGSRKLILASVLISPLAIPNIVQFDAETQLHAESHLFAGNTLDSEKKQIQQRKGDACREGHLYDQVWNDGNIRYPYIDSLKTRDLYSLVKSDMMSGNNQMRHSLLQEASGKGKINSHQLYHRLVAKWDVMEKVVTRLCLNSRRADHIEDTTQCAVDTTGRTRDVLSKTVLRPVQQSTSDGGDIYDQVWNDGSIKYSLIDTMDDATLGLLLRSDRKFGNNRIRDSLLREASDKGKEHPDPLYLRILSKWYTVGKSVRGYRTDFELSLQSQRASYEEHTMNRLMFGMILNMKTSGFTACRTKLPQVVERQAAQPTVSMPSQKMLDRLRWNRYGTGFFDLNKLPMLNGLLMSDLKMDVAKDFELLESFVHQFGTVRGTASRQLMQTIFGTWCELGQKIPAFRITVRKLINKAIGETHSDIYYQPLLTILEGPTSKRTANSSTVHVELSPIVKSRLNAGNVRPTSYQSSLGGKKQTKTTEIATPLSRKFNKSLPEPYESSSISNDSPRAPIPGIMDRHRDHFESKMPSMTKYFKMFLK